VPLPKATNNDQQQAMLHDGHDERVCSMHAAVVLDGTRGLSCRVCHEAGQRVLSFDRRPSACGRKLALLPLTFPPPAVVDIKPALGTRSARVSS
jgi:hypothetical protein